ncbi:MAG: helix-turn-helix transcriptional regulator [Lachnospiraceae bacterium]|nr:helix-turn-helix transcriptional regulator [Lachnospiraceae bacterium]
MNEEELYDLAELFKIFGDSTRIRILYALLNGEKAVSEISDEMNMTVSAISHQLRILKGSKLVRARRDGKNMYYSLDDDHVSEIIKLGLEHVEEG